MNLELLESFGQSYPEECDGTLDSISLAVTCSFNKRGTLLAVGCNDGRIVIWDFLTRGIAKIISAHMHPVSSISWSRNGKKILSASTDRNVCIWDVLSGECENKYTFPSPVMKVQFHPRNDRFFVVCPMKHASVLINLDKGHQILPMDEEEPDLTVIACFDKRGKHIYTGNGKGRIFVIITDTLEVKTSFKVVPNNAVAVKGMEFSRKGDLLLFNCSDRVVRIYNTQTMENAGKNSEIEPTDKILDRVNKCMWKKCVFSPDAEYVCAGSARQYSLHIFDRSMGNLVKILPGSKGELLLDVQWHPVRPIIASISSGVVSIWAQNQPESWSAFAPDFKELDENVEYEEKESDFDYSDEDKPAAKKRAPVKPEEDVDVDVTTVETVNAFYSSDEEDEANILDYLPLAPEIEDPEESCVTTVQKPRQKNASLDGKFK